MIKSLKSRGSSVVERIIGNDEVGSSILPRGTRIILYIKSAEITQMA